MNAAPAHSGHELDWEGWSELLRQFAAVTKTVVSVYDVEGARRVGPLIHTRTGKLLAHTALWADDGPGTALERALAQRAIASEELERERFGTELTVQALPLHLHGRACAAVVYGWVYPSFGTVLGSDQIARELGLQGAAFWREARLEPPVSTARMGMYTELLRTLADATTRHSEAIGRLHELSRMREIFLARVSHELRTPLSAIGLRLEALRRSALDDPEAIRAMLDAMAQSVDDESRLVDDLIDAARTRTGQLSLSLEPTALTPIVRAALAAVQPQADLKEITLELDAPNTALPLHGDAHRLQQVFWNLISNAVKFTPPAGRVAVSVQEYGSHYHVKVRDTGPGIDAELLPRVFDPFAKRADGNDQGLGLGLPIAKHIVELHGGSIEVHSTGMQGTIMHVALPRRCSPAKRAS